MSTEPSNGFIPADRWRLRRSGKFEGKIDPRELLLIEHPFEASEEGAWAQWETTIEPPPDWRPGRPLRVSFYQSDNYSGMKGEGPYTGVQAFIGHRFKQLLVNGQVAWERDVADEEMVGSAIVPEPTEFSFLADAARSAFAEPYQVVDIGECVRGGPVTLALRVIDKVASTTVLPGDAYKRFVWSAYEPEKARPRFWTRVFYGDVCLTTQRRPVRPAPPAPRVRPLFGKGQPVPRPGIGLDLVATDELPSPGYPVRTGVPLPRGAVRAEQSFALIDPDGRELPLSTRETSHWPDGSVRWLLCEFVAPRGGRYRLIPGRKTVAPVCPVRIARAAGGTTITTGPLALRIGKRRGDGVFDSITLDGGLATGPLDLSIKLNRVGWRDHYTAARRGVFIERETPVCAVVRIDGQMMHRGSGGPGVGDASGQARMSGGARDESFGRFRLRLHLWAGLPYVLVDWTLVNESDQAMAMLLDWTARLALPDISGATLDFGPFTPGHDPHDPSRRGVSHAGSVDDPRAVVLFKDAEASVRQERVDQGRLYRNIAWSATAERAAGFVNITRPGGGVAAAMRWFAEEFPKGIVVKPHELALATMPENEGAMAWPHDRPWVRIGRGEAKRTTFALWLHDGALPAVEAERFNACVQDQPRLFDRAWFVATHALETGPSRDEPALAAWAQKITPILEKTGIGTPRLGHREYWDTAWSNDYRGRAHQGLLQFIETADARWLRYFDAAVTHNRDVDVIHYCPEHPDWVGAVHLYGEDHTACGPMGNIGTNCDSMLDHYLLTGDPDSLAAAEGLSERLLRLNPWERCARHVGWPLAQIARWYDQTRDRRFLRRLRQLIQAAHAYVEPRRGIFAEMHGCWNYRGPVPFMTGYLAFGLIRYHRLTGDGAAVVLLRKLVEGLFAESSPRPGRFLYSPFPENNGLVPKPGPSADAGGIAGYLYLVTGDARYADLARQCHDAIMDPAEASPVSLDHITTLGWLLHALVEQEASRSPGRGNRRAREGGGGGADGDAARSASGPRGAASRLR